jgi:hypothetical protein
VKIGNKLQQELGRGQPKALQTSDITWHDVSTCQNRRFPGHATSTWGFMKGLPWSSAEPAAGDQTHGRGSGDQRPGCGLRVISG